MGENLKSFEELECWKAATDVRRFIMIIAKNFPREEKYSLTDNMMRAARSATQNIAEGFGRFHFQENVQFCRQSRGSLHELLDQLITALDEKYISSQDYHEGKERIHKALALLNGYINYLLRAKQQQLTHNVERITS
jgi:four helix bundle protein